MPWFCYLLLAAALVGGRYVMGQVPLQQPLAQDSANASAADTPAYEPAYDFRAAYPDTLNKRRLRTVIGVGAGVYVSAYAYLGIVWYGGQEQGAFRWFNDWNQWQQLDKLGHAYGAYQESRTMMSLLRWSGVPEPNVVLWGGLTGFLLQAPIEFFDGFSPAYGASVPDLVFNAAGSGLAIGNELLFGEQALQLKWSFHPTDYPDQRPDVLGANLGEQILKDYNGQTYWLSARLRAFLPPKRELASWLPEWVALSVGYGASGMIGGYGQDPAAVIHARETRHYYLSLDLDWTRLGVRGKGWRTLFFALNAIKLPFPTLSVSEHGVWRFHPVYF